MSNQAFCVVNHANSTKLSLLNLSEARLVKTKEYAGVGDVLDDQGRNCRQSIILKCLSLLIVDSLLICYDEESSMSAVDNVPCYLELWNKSGDIMGSTCVPDLEGVYQHGK